MSNKRDDFVHLHVHTEYSMLDGHAMIDDLVEEVVRLGQPGVAATDHGNMHAAYELWKKAKAADIIPVIGIEAYMAPGGADHKRKEPIFFGNSRGTDREEGSNDVSSNGAYTHQTLLAETTEGMHNLFKMSSLSSMEGYYKKPRMSMQMLAEHSKGVIGTTGCPSGDIQTRLRLGQYDEARKFAGQMQEILGRDNYFLELMDHSMKSDLERGVRNDLLRLAKELNIPLLATNDLHYVHQHDARHHEAMLALQTGHPLSEDPYHQGGRRFAFEGDSYFVKSAAQMAQIFGDYPEALTNTVLIAERAQGVEFSDGDDLRPSIDIPEGYTPETWLRKEVYEGLERRFGVHGITQEIKERAETELDVIIPKNYVMYFLVVSDFVRWAKKNNVTVGAARGSAGGSLVAYALDITEIDPIRHKLLFERFLNPERDSPPDIDMDFDDRNRGRVIDYVTQKYGTDRVASVVTFGKLKAKSALKDAARVLERPYAISDKLSKVYPPAIMGKDAPLADMFKPDSKRYIEGDDFRAMVESENAKDIVDIALGIEGRTRQTGVHAAGIILSAKPIINAVPMFMRQNDGLMITQFDYPTCETLGLLKVDFLGLQNLTILHDAIRNIKESKGVDVDLYELFDGKMDDEETYKLLRRGDTLGVFQLDSGPIRDLLRRIAPTDFDDVSATIALYRPGPMGVNAHNDYADRKNKRQAIAPIHPELKEALEPILGETYGLICYQEQVMQVAQGLAGYTLAQADNLRRAMGKKKKEVLDKEFIPFSNGMKSNGFSDEAIKTLWEVLVPFADYAFNRSHSAGYGLISYATAYLKANYPAEYMAALLTSATDNQDKTALYLNECRRMGLKVSSPTVSKSKVDYSPISDTEIVVGLGAVRGMSATTAKILIDSRPQEGYTSLQDFLNSIPREMLKVSLIGGLVDAGALDEFGYTRRAMNAALPDIAKSVSSFRKKEEDGQDSLFAAIGEDESEALPAYEITNIPEFPKQEKLARERVALGLYVSDHPLSGMADTLSSYATTSIAEINAGEVPISEGYDNNAQKQTIAGIISAITIKRTKNGDKFAIITLEDLTGSIEAPMFTKAFARMGHLLKRDHIYTFTGVPRRKDEEEPISFTIDNIHEIEANAAGLIPVWFKLTENQCTQDAVWAFKKLLKMNPGKTPVSVSIKERSGIRIIELEEDYYVNNTPLLRRQVQEMFGADCLGKWGADEDE